MTARTATQPSRRDLEARLERLEVENAKLRTIRDALIEQVDRGHDFGGSTHRVFHSIAALDTSVEKRMQRLARAMSEAKIARRQLQQAIDSIGEGFILYGADDRIVLCNRKYKTLFPELADILQPGTHFNDFIRRAAEAGVVAEAVTDPEAWITLRQEHHRQRRCQFQQLLSDGRWIQITERSTEEGGKVTTVSEITHFKRLEEARRLSEMAEQSDLLVRTVASIAQGVAVFNQQLKLVAWNSQAAMLLNLPYVEIQPGMTVRDLLKLVWRQGATVPVERKREARDWVNDAAKRPPLRLELLYSGGRCVAANFRDMPDDGFVVTMTDVSSQIQAAKLLERSKEQLEEHVNERTQELRSLNATLEDEIRRHRNTAADLERMRTTAEAANLGKTRFLAAASHDLLQPLNSARLYLSALETSPFVDPGAREILDNILQAFESIETLLSTLLDISKMDAGGYQPKLTAISLGDLFETLRTEFGAIARQKGIRLRTVHSSAVIHSDARLLRSIVQNLVSNALKYTETGSVLLGARRRGNALSIEVHDTGPGIAPEDHLAIFEEFKRLKPASKRVGGLGLGLATVKRAAALLGCKVTVRSDTGRNSCFSVTLPWKPAGMAMLPAMEASSNAMMPATRSPQEMAEGDGYLFVLENDEEVASAMSLLFDHWNLKSVMAPSYSTLLDIIRRRYLVPKIIIADLHLDDDVDGIESICRLRKQTGFDVPGILVTADRSREIQERAKTHRIEYFSKPIKPAQLRAYLFHLSADAMVSSGGRIDPGV